MLGFSVGEHPSHNVPAVDVEDDVEAVIGPLRRPEQFRDVPRPGLFGGRGHKLQLGICGVPELVAAVADLLIGLKDCERLAVEDIQNTLPFLPALGAKWRRLW